MKSEFEEKTNVFMETFANPLVGWRGISNTKPARITELNCVAWFILAEDGNAGSMETGFYIHTGIPLGIVRNDKAAIMQHVTAHIRATVFPELLSTDEPNPFTVSLVENNAIDTSTLFKIEPLAE